MSFGIYVVGFLILIGGLRNGLRWAQLYFWASRF